MRNISEILAPIKGSGTPETVIAYIRDRLESSNATNPWEQICAVLGIDENETEAAKAEVHANARSVVYQVGQALLSDDELKWPQRIEWCKTPEDFERLFIAIGIPGDKWKSPTWMTITAKLSPEEGGIGRTLSGLSYAIKKRFEYHSKFVAWMEGKSFTSVPEGIKKCKSREDFLGMFRELGIPGDNWKNSGWLENIAKLPSEEGGINQSLAHVAMAIRADERFKSFPKFVAWMEGKDKPDDPLTVRVKNCKKTGDFLALFEELGIPGDNWTSTSWLMRKARLPVEQGGIGRNLVGLVSALRKDPRFNGYSKFLAWMEGKNDPDPSVNSRVRKCNTQEDFLNLFNELGIPEDKWKTATWLRITAKLPPEEGGIGKALSGIPLGIREDNRFKSYAHFVAWMEGKPEPSLSWTKRVALCRTPEDFCNFFEAIGVPGENWRNHAWFVKISRKPLEEGGIGKNLVAVAGAIINDKRFKGFRKFIAWMDGKDAPDPTFRERVEACKTSGDFIQLFADLGIPGQKWKKSSWFTKQAALPLEQGGINRSLHGLAQAIRTDKRFSSHARFVRWMGGEELSDDYQKPERQGWIDTVRSCETPDDFLRWFRELGIQGDDWKNSQWLSKYTRLPAEEGGIGKNLAGIVGAIRADGRFDGFREFVAWMEGKEKIDESWSQKIAKCQTRDDFLVLFEELGIPGDKWQDQRWVADDARLPKENGGINTNLVSLPQAFSNDPRFPSYTEFVDWMCDRKTPGRNIKEKVAACSSPDDFKLFFTEIGIPDEKWRSYEWLVDGSKKSPEEGGIGRPLNGLSNAIQADSRFGSFRRFYKWMDGEEELDEGLTERARACSEPQDFLRLFDELGIPSGRWKGIRWLQTKPVLQTATGEQAVALEGIIIAAREKFGSYRKFVTWMQGKEKPDLPWKDRIAPLNTPDDFRDFFAKLNIPDEKWRSSSWLQAVAVKSPKNGGIGQAMQGLADALRKRFNSHPEFVAWMDGKERELSMAERVRLCITRNDFFELFEKLGIPDGAWKVANWFTAKAKLPVEKGGVGRSLSSIPETIRKDDRWESYAAFAAWLEGKELKLAHTKRAAQCQTSADFLEWFIELGIPDDKWRSGQWLSEVAKLSPEKGGIGKNMAAVASAIRKDKRFNGYPQFVAWMEGEEYRGSLASRVKECRTREDYLQLFRELGVPDEKWRNTNWLRNVAPLPQEEGGIGKTLRSLPSYINSNHPEFTDYPFFVAWMDGMPPEGIQSAKVAEQLLRLEAERFNVSVEELLDENKIHGYLPQSSILMRIMEYFSSLET